MNSLIINEIFYSIQGESLNTGVPTIFIRLTGCPLRCNYCDTEYAFHEGSKMSFQNIFSKIKSYNCKTVTVTGGEPLSQNNTLLLLDELCENDYLVGIETSNAITIKNINKNVTIILDIKTPDSGESEKNIIDNYKLLKKEDQVKFVVCSLDDYNWARNYIYKHNLHHICKVLISPSHNEMNIKVLAEKMLFDSIPARLQIQMHKIIWNNQRGK